MLLSESSPKPCFEDYGYDTRNHHWNRYLRCNSFNIRLLVRRQTPLLVTTTEYKQALRSQYMILSDAVAAEDWQKVFTCAENIAQYAKFLLLDEEQSKAE